MLATFNLTAGVADGVANSLRATITATNSNSANDTINLAAGTYTLTSTGANEDNNATGDLDVKEASRTLTITGAGADVTIIDASALTDRIFDVAANVTLILSGVTIKGGTVTGVGGGIRNLGTTNVTSSEITNNTARGADGVAAIAGTVSGLGGGIYNAGTLTLQATTLANNQVVGGAGGRGGTGPSGSGSTKGGGGGGGGGLGGAIYNEANATLMVQASTFSTNTATGGLGGQTTGGTSSGNEGNGGGGGGLGGAGQTSSVTNAAGGFAGGGGGHRGGSNVSGSAGGRYGGGGGASGAALFGGSAAGGAAGFGGGAGGGSSSITGGGGGGGGGFGGAIFNYGGTATVQSSTFSSNTATGGAGSSGGVAGEGRGGGIYFDRSLSSGSFTVNNSILIGNTATTGEADAGVTGGSLTSGGFNLTGASTGFPTGGTNDITAASATTVINTTLAYVGGPVRVLFPKPGSTALDAGTNVGITLTNDQRGAARTTNLTAVTNLPGSDGTDIGAVELLNNTPPTLSTVASPTLTTIAEDTAAASITGTLVSTLLGSSITDTDALAVQGIAVTSIDNTNGAWQYSTNGTSYTAFGTTSASSATLLLPSSLVRFVPNANFNGTVSLGYRAWDRTDARNVGDTAVDTSTGGATSAFSTATETASVTVSAVNDAATITLPASVGGAANTPVSIPGISIADLDAASSNVQVTLVVTNGTLTMSTLTGLSFSFNDGNGTGTGDGSLDTTMVFRGTLTSINTALASLSFTPTNGFKGNAALSVTVNDLGNTGSGGVLITGPSTLQIAVGGLRLLKDFNGTSTSANIEQTVLFNNELFFSADFTGGSADRPYRLNPTTGVVTAITQSNAPTTSNVVDLFKFNGRLYGVMASSVGFELFQYNSATENFDLHTNLNGTGDGFPTVARDPNGDPVIFNNDLILTASDTSTGQEIFRLRADNNQLALLKDVLSGTASSFANSFTVFNNKLYFEADDASANTEPYVYDSSSGNATVVSRANPASGQDSNLTLLFVFNNNLFTSINSDTGRDLFKLNTANNTFERVADLNGTTSSSPQLAKDENGDLVYSGSDLLMVFTDTSTGSELYKLQASNNQIVLVKDILAGTGSSFPNSFTNFNGDLYLEAQGASGLSEPYKLNLTTGAVTLIANGSRPSGGVESNLTSQFVFDDRLFAVMQSASGRELYQYNAATTTYDLSTDLNGTGDGSPSIVTDDDNDLLVIGTTLLVRATDTTTGQELFAIDGSITDNTAPTVTGVSSSTADGSYKAGNAIGVTVTFSENVTVTGTPTLTLETGSTDAVLNYASGTGTNTLTFNYTVASGHASADLDYASAGSLQLNGGTIKDAAGNNAPLTLPAPSAAGSLGANKALVVDGVVPTVTSFVRQTPLAATTNADSVVFRVTFSETVTGVGTTDFAVNGSTTATVTNVATVSGSQYDVTISGGNLATFGGAVGLNFAASPTITDIATNAFVVAEPATDEVYTLDNTAPAATSFVRQTPSATTTNADSLVFRVTFNETVTGVGTTDFAVSGSTATVSTVTAVSGTQYDVTVSGGNLTGLNSTVGLNFSAPTITDAAGNALPSTEPATDQTYTLDNTAPSTTSFALQTPASAATNADTLVFRATFNETVTGVDTADFAVNGTTTATVTNVTAVSGTQYDITVSGGNLASFNGVVGLNFAASPVIADAAGNAVPSTEPATDATFTLDNTAPTVSSFVRQTPSTASTNANSLVFRVTFSEAVTGVGTADFAVNGTTTATVTNVATVSTSQYDVTISGGNLASFNGTVGLNLAASPIINDSTGNALQTGEPATDEIFTLDNVVPTVTSFVRQNPSASPTNADSLVFRVTFSETVTGVGTTDFAVNGTTTAAVTNVATVSGSQYDVTISGGNLVSFNGTVGLNFSAPSITDAASNSVASSEPLTDELYTLDNTTPVTSSFARQTPSAASTNLDSLVFRVTYNEAVTGVDTADFAVNGSTTATVTNVSVISGTVYDVTVSGGDLAGFSGTVGLNYAASISIADVAGNAVATTEPATDQTYTLDNLAPTVSMTSTATDPTNVSPIIVTVTFSESVTGFALTDIIVTNGTKSNFTGSGSSYTFRITPSAQGTVTADIAGNVATDATGNSNTAATQFSRVYDNVSPTVSITSTASDPTNVSPIPMTVTFSSAVTGFDSSDLDIGNGSFSDFAGTGAVYTFNLIPSGQGTVTVDVAANAAIDGASNGNTVASQFDIVFDTVAPSTTSFVRQTPSGASTNADSLVFRVTFSESVTGVSAADFVRSGTTTATVTNVNPISGSVYDVTVSGGNLASFTGSVGLNFAASPTITDLAGNSLPNTEPTTDQTYSVDSIAPTIFSFARQTPSGALTNANSVVFRATFSEDVMGVASADFGINSLTSATVTNVNPISASVYDVTISGGNLTSFNGTLELDLSASAVISDLAGNALPFVDPATDEVYNFDNTIPVLLSFVRHDPVSSATNADTLNFYANFSEDVTGVAANDFAIQGTTTATITAVTLVSGSIYEITVSGGDLATFNGNVGLNVAASPTITDGATNALAATQPAIDETYDVDNTRPTITLRTTATSTTNVSPIPITVTFSESVSDLELENIVVSGGVASNFTGSGANYSFDVTPTGDGTVTVDVAADVAFDDAHNGNTVATQLSRIFDQSNPMLLSFTRQTPSAGATNSDSLVFRATFSGAVTGVDATDFAVSSSSTATITNISSVDSSTYVIAISGGDLASFNGTIELDLLATTDIADGAKNVIAIAEPATDENFLVDNTVPTVVSFERQTPASSATNADQVVFRVIFSEDVTGIGAPDFSITGTTATVTKVTAVDAATYDLTVSGGDLDNLNGTVGLNFSGALSATDLAGNAVVAAEPTEDETFAIDNKAPTVAIAPDGTSTNASSITFTFEFSEDVTGFTKSDVSVGNGSAGTFTPVDGDTYTLAVTPTADGKVTVSVANDAAQDAASNGVVQNSASITSDRTLPTVSLSQVTDLPGGMATVTATLSKPWFDDVTIGLSMTGTATLGSDYTRSGTQIVIPAGMTTGTLQFTLLPDNVDEPVETIVVGLGALTNGTVGTPNSVTVSILDDDPAPITATSNGGTIEIDNSANIPTDVRVTYDSNTGEIVIVSFTDGAGATEMRFPASGVTGIDVHLGPMNDRFDASLAPVAVTVDGGTGNDTIMGGAYLDSLNGGTGNDELLGSGGKDTLTGGQGDDTLDGGSSSDMLVEQGDVDMFLTNTSLTGMGSDTLIGIEAANLTGGNGANVIDASGASIPVGINGGAGADTLTGSSVADTLNGGTGNDVLFGYAGRDVLSGALGNDFLDGGASEDVLLGGDGVDTGRRKNDTDFVVTNTALTELLGGNAIAVDTMNSVEAINVMGGIGNNRIDLSNFNNLGIAIIHGGGGNDTITGTTGLDFITTTDGNDVVDGLDGADSINAGAGNDSVIGGGGNDRINAEDGADTVAGDAGNDYITGGDGIDSLSGGNGDDFISLDIGGGTISGGDGGDLLLGSSDADTLQGDAGNDHLFAEAGDDVMSGGAGNDSLQGGDGADTVQGGDGDDQLTGGAGTDTQDGGAGINRLSEFVDGTIVITGTQMTSAAIGTETPLNISRIVLMGGLGADFFDARLATVSVQMQGSIGNDTLLGGVGKDQVFGGDGNDVLSGGANTDTLDGGSGTDVVYEVANANVTVNGFQIVSAATGTETPAAVEGIVLVGGAGNNVLNANASSVPVTLLGGGGNDTLAGSAQADVLVGGNRANPASGLDSLTGGAGADVFDNDASDVRITGAGDQVVANVFAQLPSWVDQI